MRSHLGDEAANCRRATLERSGNPPDGQISAAGAIFLSSSATKQSSFVETGRKLDCFASLAMTGTTTGEVCAAGSVVISRPAYSGAALSPRALDSFVANDAATITTVINASTSVQMALISGFTPSRTSE